MHLPSYIQIFVIACSAAVRAIPAEPNRTGPRAQITPPAVLVPRGEPESVETVAVDGQTLTAHIYTSLAPEYEGLRADVQILGAHPPKAIYPRAVPIFGVIGVAVVAYLFAADGRLESQRIRPISMQELGIERPKDAQKNDESCFPLDDCDNPRCDGNHLQMCTAGPKKGCPCGKTLRPCPDFDDWPQCDDQSCRGNTYDVCTTGEHEGCPCEGPVITLTIVEPLDFQWVKIQQDILANLGALNMECPSGLNVDGLGTGYQTSSTEEPPSDILYIIRTELCTDLCRIPQSLPLKTKDKLCKIYPSEDSTQECEISIALGEHIEAWGYRSGSIMDNYERCWDDIEDLIENCIKNEGKWGSLSYPEVSYRVGFRAKNSPDKKHEDFDPNYYLTDLNDPYCRTSDPPIGDINNVRARAVEVCKAFKDNNVKLNQEENQLPSDASKYTQIKGAAANGNELVFSVVWSLRACSAVDVPTEIDFSTFSQDTCIHNFIDKGASKCPNGSGAVSDCAIWSVNALTNF